MRVSFSMPDVLASEFARKNGSFLPCPGSPNHATAIVRPHCCCSSQPLVALLRWASPFPPATKHFVPSRGNAPRQKNPARPLVRGVKCALAHFVRLVMAQVGDPPCWARCGWSACCGSSTPTTSTKLLSRGGSFILCVYTPLSLSSFFSMFTLSLPLTHPLIEWQILRARARL